MTSPLALLGGEKAVQSDPGNTFVWPIITPEMEAAVLEVLRAGAMSGVDVTRKFEQEFAAWHGMTYALAHNTGTAALETAMFAIGIGAGDEIICPSLTYWASALPVYALGGTVVFADVAPHSLCIDPRDIEHRITARTKAIVAVHYKGYPADMDAIMEIARRHHLKVIEDGSHAHGACYKGRLVGAIGDVSAFSLMSGKSFAVGEGGILLTNDRATYERAIAFAHYERHGELTLEDLAPGAGLPLGGHKYRMHQLSSAVGRVQIKNYPAQMAEIDRAMNAFCDGIEGLRGLGPHRPPSGSGLTMGGWYAPSVKYCPEELGGLSATRFCQALAAERVTVTPGANKPLHLHPLFNTLDVYRQGRPTREAHLPQGADIRQPEGSLPVTEEVQHRILNAPWFKKYRPDIIAEYVAAFKKVSSHYQELLPGDPGNPPDMGSWGLSVRRDA
ncbi:MAG: DegT/DnrJ/EryC1/StrS family aminotransferase [Chloroflexi bacterium]|nr:DegT/DnrJ/EryC1/StrS family aminotransferase [Chloroflexota bacterium]